MLGDTMRIKTNMTSGDRPMSDFWCWRMGWSSFIAFAILWMPWIGMARAAEELTHIADVRALSRDRAALELRVHVRGVVTWLSDRETFTVQDDTAGIWVNLDQARQRNIWRGDDAAAGEIHEGMEVEIEGLSDPGGYAPIILPVNLRVLGAKPLPPPLAMEPARFFNGAADCQRVEVRGVVQGFYPWANGVTLLIDANPGQFTAQVSSEVAPDLSGLVDAEVRLRGIAATRFNTRGEATGSRMIVSVPGDLIVEKPPPPPDEVPWVTLDRLLPFRAKPIGPHRVRVEGTVTYSLPGKFFYLQESDSAIRVETNSSMELDPGDRVEAAGFVEISRLIGTLNDATVRKTGVANVPEAVEITPEEILDFNKLAMATGEIARPNDYDGHLIRCHARLLAVQSEPNRNALHTLTLEKPNAQEGGTLIFRAFLNNDVTKALDSLGSGSELELTGLVQLEYDSNESPLQPDRTIPVNLNLILRSAADVVVLSRPSW